MSQETSEWLNQNVLIGFTDQRGMAWHYRASDQGLEPNHYPGAVPVGDVLRRLFDFDVIGQPIYITDLTGEYHKVPERQAMVAQDTHDVFGVFKDGFVGHSYREWLLESVATILDDTLAIGSAGLLKNRAVAWVSVEVPDSITTKEGVEFRPNLVAATSFDGSLATTYQRAVTNVVCDNTLAAGLAEKDQRVKIKHSKYSALRIESARDALNIVYTIADDFQKELDDLCSWSVSEQDWSNLLNVTTPRPDDKGRAQTMADDKREKLDALYHWDQRCAPWKDTAYGVMQTYNTYEHHGSIVRGHSRAERNMLGGVMGTFAAKDSDILRQLATVQG